MYPSCITFTSTSPLQEHNSAPSCTVVYVRSEKESQLIFLGGH